MTRREYLIGKPSFIAFKIGFIQSVNDFRKIINKICVKKIKGALL